MIFIALVLAAADALAMPMFARQVGRDCTFCHNIIPGLNETGRIFRQGGYRLEDEGEWTEVRDLKSIPISAGVEVEGFYDRLTASGITSESSGLKVEEVELMTGGAFGKTGRVSALAMVLLSDTGSSTEVTLHRGVIQVNDLAGPVGAGRLNLRAGLWEAGLPFLNAARSPISNSYLADSVLGLIGSEQRAVEINGSLIDYDSPYQTTHRWGAGITREDINGDDKLKGVYAYYALTLIEDYNVGVIYRAGEEARGAIDASYNRTGIGAGAESGPLMLTAGVFFSEVSGFGNAFEYLVEAVFMPTARLSVAARYDQLQESGKKGVKSHSLMTRYNILSNAYLQLEYRGLNDDDHISGANEDETKVRLLVAAFF